MAKSIGVVLFGCGNVGLTVGKRLQDCAASHAKRYGLRFDLRAIVDSRGALFDAEALANLGAIADFKQQGNSLAQHAQGVSTSEDIAQHLEPLASSGNIFVDCTATDRISGQLIEAIQRGAGVVFANKKVLTGDWSTFQQLTGPDVTGRCRFESSVGAGSPFVAAVSRVAAAGDAVHRIQGTFSGTLGFITAGLDKGRSLSELVREAYDLGYTEPDPRDDLSGMDVARKALILARVCGWSLEMSDVDVQGLYPASLSDVSVADFLARIGELDADIAAQQEAAAKEDCVLRYVAEAGPQGCQVGLRPVPRSSPIGALSGTDNILNVHSDIYSSTPLVIQGSGAGADITAAGVVADMVEIAVARFP
ncbi:uncharacterized protein MONBRDRAFT_34304 [Monosiga brevicollis MX1]|uniref:Homoserine dehydrogenase n=1 Tax=Monosiga brevicollis TaxID=81824 RepID=A9VAU2_MONBE|nr:uncharacterized protein MONBRDRAFT_34304 [Monosiga brevicollis MX1]EDQ85379.1 predicted protein [Monosiga brevicollis MX1]|eukprot:XP_001749790.1 hypothetical protein [Monosiga brevicollis MX1]